MKTEEFDDAVKRKLESINHTYSDNDIEKVFQHVQKKRGFSWKSLNGSWLIYSLSAAAMIAVTTWMVYKQPFKETAIKQLVTKSIKKTTNEIPVATVIDSVPANNRYTSKTVENIVPLTRNDQPVVESKVTIQTKLSQNNQASKPEQVAVSVPQENPTNTTNLPVADAVPSSNEKTKKQNEPVTKLDIGSQIIPAVVAESTNTAIVTELKNEVVEPKAEIAETASPAIPVAEKSNIPADSKLTLPADTAGVTIKTESKNSRGFKVRPAILFNISNQKIGTGLAADVLIGKYFGFTVGATYNWLQTEQFADKADMYGHRPPGMNPDFDNHFQNKEHVTDITIHKQLLQLPVAINCYFPLSHNFNLRMTVGTELDVFLNQQITFNHQVDSSQFDNPHFESQGKVIPFNSLLFGGGVEKRWNQLALCVQPYYNLHFTDVFYKPKEPEFGVGINLIYSFGK